MEKSYDLEQVRSLTLAGQLTMLRIRNMSFVVALGAFALGVLVGLKDFGSVLKSFHVVVCLLTAIFAGCLFFIVVQHATSAGWSVLVRRIPEAVASQAWILVLFFLPSLLGSAKIFKWLKVPAGSDYLIDVKRPYLNFTFFLIRVVFYLCVLVGLSWRFSSQSIKQDETGDYHISARLRTLSYPSLFLFALTVTFFSIDFIKSLDPHWYSTMFGVYFFAGSVVTGLALIILLSHVVLFRGLEPGTPYLNDEHRHDLGKLLFGFNVFWTYIAVSQLLLIWYANIPEETLFFAHRWEGGWAPISLLLAIGHFPIPFLFLLPRTIKRHPKTLMAAAAWLLLMEYVDLFWLIMPNYRHHFSYSLTDLCFLIGTLALVLGLSVLKLMKSSLVPRQDPRLIESLSYDHPL